MGKTFFAIFFLASAGMAAGYAWIAQQPQVPEKYKFALDLIQKKDSWPEYTPETITTQAGKFKPIRAVFDRQTRMNSDNPLKIRAVWTVDQVLWNGEPVTEVGWFSTGGTPISSIAYLDPETSALRFRHVTSANKSTLTVVHPDKVVDTEVKIDGEVKTETLALSHKVFDRYGIGYALAAMQLEEGMAFWLKGVYPGRKSIDRYAIIIGKREAITDAKGRNHEVWPALMPLNEGWVGHYYVDNRAPYFFGFEYKNVLTGEVSMSVRLEEQQELK